MSGNDLAREPGLGEQRDHRLGEMPLPVQPAQPLIGPVTFSRLPNRCSSSQESEGERDRDADLGDDRDLREERKGSERAVCKAAGVQDNISRKGRMEEEV